MQMLFIRQKLCVQNDGEWIYPDFTIFVKKKLVRFAVETWFFKSFFNFD